MADGARPMYSKERFLDSAYQVHLERIDSYAGEAAVYVPRMGLVEIRRRGPGWEISDGRRVIKTTAPDWALYWLDRWVALGFMPLPLPKCTLPVQCKTKAAG